MMFRRLSHRDPGFHSGKSLRELQHPQDLLTEVFVCLSLQIPLLLPAGIEPRSCLRLMPRSVFFKVTTSPGGQTTLPIRLPPPLFYHFRKARSQFFFGRIFIPFLSLFFDSPPPRGGRPSTLSVWLVVAPPPLWLVKKPVPHIHVRVSFLHITMQ